jgi:hypothetical protein
MGAQQLLMVTALVETATGVMLLVDASASLATFCSSGCLANLCRLH